MYGVLGGGISGLAASYYLLNSPCSVKIIEASHRLGGWIKTSKNQSGHIFEQGPRTIRPKGEAGENTLELISELGLSNDVIPIPTNHAAAQNRMIYVNKKLYTLPSNIFSLLFTRPPFTKPIINALFQDLKAPKKVGKDESIYDFVQRRLGKEIADYAISPLVCGVCAGDAKEISVKLLMNSLYEAEQSHGSIIRGMIRNLFNRKGTKHALKINRELLTRAKDEKWSVYSFQDGLEVLPHTLEKKIRSKGCEILLNTPCEEITFVDPITVAVRAGGKDYIFDNLISSLPAQKLAPFVEKQHPKLSRALAGISSVSVGVVNLQYEGKVVKDDAFGFLVPSSENIPILGIVYDSCCFPKGDNTILTVMMGGRWFEKQFGTNPTTDVLFNTATSQVNSILGISVQPQSHRVSILKDCIPQYVVGHHERVNWIKSYIESQKLPLTVIGASYDGVSVNDVILSARRSVEQLMN